MDPATLGTAASIASGLLSTNSSPAMARGDAYGSPVTVGGLTINKKPDWLPIIGAALLGGAAIWLIKR